MASVLNDTWEWLYRAEEARKAAEQLTDPDAKQCMLQLGSHYDGLARGHVRHFSANDHTPFQSAHGAVARKRAMRPRNTLVGGSQGVMARQPSKRARASSQAFRR